jgi:hypothetical protein
VEKLSRVALKLQKFMKWSPSKVSRYIMITIDSKKSTWNYLTCSHLHVGAVLILIHSEWDTNML